MAQKFKKTITSFENQFIEKIIHMISQAFKNKSGYFDNTFEMIFSTKVRAKNVEKI